MAQAPSHETIRKRRDSDAPNVADVQNAAAQTADACAAANAPRSSEASREGSRTRAKATAQVFLGGASYGAMATTYKLSYAAGFTSNQVVAGQGWTSCFLFAVAFLIGMARGKRWQPIGAKCTLKLLGLGCLTCTTSILYC